MERIVVALFAFAWTYGVWRVAYAVGRRRGLYLGGKIGYGRRKSQEWAKAYGASNRKLREMVH